MDERSRLIKHTVPLIEDYEDRFKQFKDSEVIMKNGKYIILIGAESRSENGCIAVFEADNESDFEYKGILETDLEEFGWLWEYPDYFSVDGRDILKSSRDTPTASRILPGLFPEYLLLFCGRQRHPGVLPSGRRQIRQ